MRGILSDEIIIEMIKEPWFSNLTDSEYLFIYEPEDNDKQAPQYGYTGADWWFGGYYNCLTISRPITILRREALHTYIYPQLHKKPIKYALRKPTILRI